MNESGVVCFKPTSRVQYAKYFYFISELINIARVSQLLRKLCIYYPVRWIFLANHCAVLLGHIVYHSAYVVSVRFKISSSLCWSYSCTLLVCIILLGTLLYYLVSDVLIVFQTWCYCCAEPNSRIKFD